MAKAARPKIVPAQLERRAYERLRDDILSGVLRPGDPLVESRIAEELGVSKTPVREALIRLQRDGLVTIEPYRGARVIELAPEDIREILELRLVLEREVARELARRRPPETLAALEGSLARSKSALARRRQRELLDSLTEFSDVQAQACGNRRMAKLLVDLRSALLIIGHTSLRAAGRVERSIAEHEAILTAIRSGDPEAAARATEAHIRSIERDSLGEPAHSGQ